MLAFSSSESIKRNGTSLLCADRRQEKVRRERTYGDFYLNRENQILEVVKLNINNLFLQLILIFVIFSHLFCMKQLTIPYSYICMRTSYIVLLFVNEKMASAKTHTRSSIVNSVTNFVISD